MTTHSPEGGFLSEADWEKKGMKILQDPRNLIHPAMCPTHWMELDYTSLKKDHIRGWMELYSIALTLSRCCQNDVEFCQKAEEISHKVKTLPAVWVGSRLKSGILDLMQEAEEKYGQGHFSKGAVQRRKNVQGKASSFFGAELLFRAEQDSAIFFHVYEMLRFVVLRATAETLIRGKPSCQTLETRKDPYQTLETSALAGTEGLG